jgi:hypothetical protein
MKTIITILVTCATLLAQEKPKAVAPLEVTAAQLVFQKAVNAMYRAELAKRQFVDAQRDHAMATAEQQRFTEEYKLAEAAALKALGKSPELYSFNAETGQAQPKEAAKK